MSIIVYAGAGILGAGIIAGVVYYIRWAMQNSVALGQRDAAIALDQARINAEEAAKDAARTARAAEFQHEKDAAVSAAAAAELLQHALDGTSAH